MSTGNGEAISAEVFLSEARRLVDLAQERGLVLRALGGVGIRLCCDRLEGLAQRLQRGHSASDDGEGQEFADLDFAAYRRQRKQFPAFFDELGYIKRPTTLASAISERHIYFHPRDWFAVDVFFDTMKMEHDLPLVHRLELTYPTITPTDLLLSKVQVTHLTEKDVKDLWLLLLAHPVEDRDGPEVIEAGYVARVLARDWGFWYDATTNIERVWRRTEESTLFGPERKADILAKLHRLRERIAQEPKSLRWKLRAVIGARLQWYRPVEDGLQ